LKQKFIYLDQTKNQLPLLSTDFFFVNPQMILHTSCNREEILEAVLPEIKSELLFGLHMHPGGVYPRFNRDKFFYNVSHSPLYSYLPNLETFKKIDFFETTDRRAIELENKSLSFKNVYVFWSGGMDSTLILAAILKNWKNENLEKLVVVLNQHSIDENKNMYENYIHAKLKTESTDKFFNGELNFSNENVYVDGNVGDTVSYLMLEHFDAKYPGYYNKPWKKHINILIEHFSEYETIEHGRDTYKRIVRSLNENKFEVETIYDFLWWMTFNWLHDKLLYNILWQYTPCFNQNLDIKNFLETNMFQWFNGESYQDWLVSTIGTDERIGRDITTNKLAFKKYIFDFNKDQDYFFNKRKEASTPRNAVLSNHKILCAIDTEYNYYYRYTQDKIWPPK
jgi:hypothetical protein